VVSFCTDSKCQIRNLLEDAMNEAVKLEQVVKLIKGSTSIGDAEVSAAIERVRRWLDNLSFSLDSFDCLTCTLTEMEKNAFRLALIEAFRNVVRHMWDAYLDINVVGNLSITTGANFKTIEIRNYIVLRYPSAYRKGRDCGTKSSIQSHVKCYNPMGSSLTRLEQTSQQIREGDGYSHEEWVTVVPLPSNTVGEYQ